MSIDLGKAFTIRIRKARNKELYWAECSCTGYSSRPASQATTESLARRHAECHIDRLRHPWSAILVGVGIRYLDERRVVQLLATTVDNRSQHHRRMPAFNIDMTTDQARSLAAELNRCADETEDQ